ncbi:MAG: RidA family protein [Phycisphaerae bacterium]
MKQRITGPNVAPPSGPYSPGLRVGDWIFVSGQGPIDPRTGQISGQTIEEQTRQTLDNIKAILEAAGASLDDCVKVTAHLRDMADFEAYNRVYETFFGDPKPARTTVQSGLAANMRVEIDVIAHRPTAG